MEMTHFQKPQRRAVLTFISQSVMRNVETYYTVVTILYILDSSVFSWLQRYVTRYRPGDGMGDGGFGSHQGQETSLLQNIHSGSRVHPASYTPGTVGSFWSVERTGRDVEHSHPFGAEVKNEQHYTTTPHTRLHGEDTDI
jgi:hypothetical protein